VAEVEDVLTRLAGKRVRLQCRSGVPYENPVAGRVQGIVAGQVLLRVHPTRIDGIPLSDIISVDVLTEDEER
jgi:hypothetical protein